MSETSPTETLSAEHAALDRVATCATAQLDALRTGDVSVFEAAAAETLAAVSDLDRRQRDRARFGLSADDARAALREPALVAQRACDTLAEALEHAVALGRDLLGTWHRTAAPSAQAYTADGRAGTPDTARLDAAG